MSSNNLNWRYSLTVTLFLISPFDLLASLGMDMYLPVVPAMAVAFHAGNGAIQLTLTAYLILLGAGQLVFGPLSDRVGRRPVLLVGGIVFVLASLGLMLSSSIGVFLTLRVFQAVGASACLVAVFAAIRDIYSGRDEANVIYGLLGSMLALVPALGPLLGSLMNAWLGWRGIFGFLAIGMAIAVLGAFLFWPETCRGFNRAPKIASVLKPLKHMNFWFYTFSYSAGMGSFFVFFSVAPWLLMDRHGVSPMVFSLLFATVASAMVVTARFIGKIVSRMGDLRVLRFAMGCLATGGLLLGGGEIFDPGSIAVFIVPMWVVAVGIAAVVAVAPNGALSGLDHIAGAATAMYFCLGGVLLGSIGSIAVLLFPRASVWPIVLYCVGCGVAVLALSLHFRLARGRL